MGVTERILTSASELCTTGTLVLFLLNLTLVYIVRHLMYLRSLPPGPIGVPFLGSLPNIKKAFHLQMFDYAREYGKLVSVKMGSQLVVIINDAKLLKRTFARAEFTARPKSALDEICEGYGLITADGGLWQNQRRFLHKHKFGLKFWGDVSQQMEARVSHEVMDCLNTLVKDSDFDSAESKSMDLSSYLSCSLSNVICSIIMSTRFKHNTEQFTKFLNFFEEGFRLFTLTGAMIFLPILKYLPKMSNTVEKLKQNRAQLLTFVAEIVDEHKKTLDAKTPRDLVDQYLIEIEKCEAEGTTEAVFETKDPDTQLQQILVDLFSAGFETVKTTLLWTIIHMLRNPAAKRKVQAELEEVVGPNRLPRMEDMQKLTYTRACIYESMRRTLAVPMGTTHSNKSPVLIEDRLIPANSHVIPNLHAIHMDPEVWAEPEEYRPERFLEAETGRLVKPREFVPFGVGQRMCLGDSLAETELQLFFASILHVFDIASEADSPLPSLEGNFGATMTPSAFSVKLLPRNVEAVISANTKAKPECSHQMRIYG